MLALTLFPLLAAARQIPLLPPESDLSGLRDRLRHVLPEIEALKNIGGTTGMSIGVMSHGNVVLETNLGFADVERRLVANSSTIYPVASLTKAFTAVTIAQLVDEGLLNWDEPLTSYIPELSFEHDPSLAGQLSLIDVLSHRTGLAQLDNLWLGADSQTLVAKNFTVSLCNHLSPVYPVRSQWLYNNWMYALAGEVIERVTNQSWGQVLSTRVLKRLQLSHTTAIASEIPRDSVALPYVVLDDLTPVRVGSYDLTDGSAMAAAGGIRSTVGDLLTWGSALLSVFRNGETPLALLDAVFSGRSFMNSTATPDELYTMGFVKVMTPAQIGTLGLNPSLVDAMPLIGTNSKPQQVFYHSGALTGYNHCFILVPESQSVIVVLTNSISQGETPCWVAQSLLQAVLNEKHPLDMTKYAEQAAAKWRTIHQGIAEALEKGRKPNSPEPIHELLLGKYWHKTRAIYLDVFQENGILKFNINGKPEQEHVLSHYRDDTFVFLPSADQRIRNGLFLYGPPSWLLHFKKDSSGNFTEIQWDMGNNTPFPEKFIKE
ncbi:beta-lactamase/transpeptidase-like protein [Trichoderma sp. SZMC 28011]